MPEGDTIHRAARALGEALAGQPVLRYWAHRPQLLAPRREGHVITTVEARGKNLLIHFDDQRALYSHMKMTGAWHVYGHDERWRRAQARARVIIESEGHVAVCFDAPVIELLTAPELLRHPTLSRLGPDLLDEPLDEDGILAGFARHPALPLGEAVMNQGIAAGIGNVYKSEMLFLARLSPFLLVEAVPQERLRKLVQDTAAMMRRNLGPGMRTTRTGPGTRLWVYERSGQACLRCRTRIQMRRQGEQARSTYFCPRCQGVG